MTSVFQHTRCASSGAAWEHDVSTCLSWHTTRAIHIYPFHSNDRSKVASLIPTQCEFGENLNWDLSTYICTHMHPDVHAIQNLGVFLGGGNAFLVIQHSSARIHLLADRLCSNDHQMSMGFRAILSFLPATHWFNLKWMSAYTLWQPSDEVVSME